MTNVPRKDPSTGIADLRNLGPKSAQWLAEIGIHTLEDLEQVGAILAYRMLKHRFPQVSLNMLYGLHAALTGQKWNEIPLDERARLKLEAEEAMRTPPRI